MAGGLAISLIELEEEDVGMGVEDSDPRFEKRLASRAVVLAPPGAPRPPFEPWDD